MVEESRMAGMVRDRVAHLQGERLRMQDGAPLAARAGLSILGHCTHALHGGDPCTSRTTIRSETSSFRR